MEFNLFQPHAADSLGLCIVRTRQKLLLSQTHIHPDFLSFAVHHGIYSVYVCACVCKREREVCQPTCSHCNLLKVTTEALHAAIASSFVHPVCAVSHNTHKHAHTHMCTQTDRHTQTAGVYVCRPVFSLHWAVRVFLMCRCLPS